MSPRFSMPLAMTTLLVATVSAATSATPFAERITSQDPVRLWMFPDSTLDEIGTVRDLDGPPTRVYPTFPDPVRAAGFDGTGYLRLPAGGSDPDYQFTNGDTITLEAWVRCDHLPSGRIQYIVGKGRTGRPGYPADNQNWGLRLQEKGGQARLSFLFRSQPSGDHPGDYHRWTTNRGFYPGSRWHHVAVTYAFGKPDSIAGWIDGQAVDGQWDMGGATTHPPVVDDDEVWIGSTRGGDKSGSLHGALACLALYRHAVPGFEDAYEAKRYVRPLDVGAIPPDRVQVEVFRADSGRNDWPAQLDTPLRVFDAEGFGLFQLPPRYGPQGERLEQDGVVLLRMAGTVALPAGEYEVRFRAPGLSQVTIGNDSLLTLPPARIVRDAHGPLRDFAALHAPAPRLGVREAGASFQSDGNPLLVVVETLVGDRDGKVQVGEILLAARRSGEEDAADVLLTPASTVAFTGPALELYRQREDAHHDRLNTITRRELAARADGPWHQRHEQARSYISSLEPLEIPEPAPGDPPGSVIDRFIHARIRGAAPASSEAPSAFRETVHPLLEEHCFRCHGEKSKGGLRLDSRHAALEGGDSGPALTPGHPETSELLLRIQSTDREERMPPKGERLSSQEVAALSSWIEQGAPWEAAVTSVEIPPDLDERSFLRRLYLDTVGVFPTPEEVNAYLSDSSPDKTARLVDRLLDDPRHADHWVSYWQDVLAENPRLVKPTLNNTGPFRYWLHEALLDNKPFDRFVTELVSFQGGTYSGAAGGFKLATQNDVPMAAKAHVVGTAFLGLEMKCARCHDAPFHSLTQEDLFSMAAMMKGAPLEVPGTSTVPATFFDRLGDRESRIKVTLDPSTPVAPTWPFKDLAPPLDEDSGLKSPVARLAYQITRPENHRFARVVVNRIWKRYFGQGIVEPADDWEGNDPSHPGLLDYLAREFVSHGYDLHHVSRLILNSAAYRRAPRHTEVASAESRFFEAPLRRRMSAEQLVDSLFAATGTPVFSEELTLDVEGWYPDKNFLNLGRPRRAWEFVSLSTERDRPSLTLPRAQAIVSFLEAYGWRSNRAEPLTERPAEPDVLQAGMLANGLLGTWWTRLSDYSELTRLAVQATSPDELLEDLYLRLLTRLPTEAEREVMLAQLEPDFDSRLTAPASEFVPQVFTPEVRHISWRNHLHPDSNVLAAEIEDRAVQGPPPTDFLTAGWRTRFEDVVWSLLNAPEMQFLP